MITLTRTILMLLTCAYDGEKKKRETMSSIPRAIRLLGLDSRQSGGLNW